uniref:Beta-1,4-N-acetylgalactosaminyltransferase n=1 Tax=Oncorhynchus kisutch TaxID=8019 RepID=A0A8C7G427_ONCKI
MCVLQTLCPQSYSIVIIYFNESLLSGLSLSLSPQFKGQANLHVFEDWCGSSVAQLRKNLHFPLYPHTRTTVKKLAVAPKWKNYGLRIFGFIHPYRDGDFQFSVSSDDNSEFWVSPDESPLNARLLVYVGQLGTEWTAPGEFSKFRSQSSKSVHLISSRRYYFEILHKQDDKGSDHVEVGWRPFLPGLKYEVIDSAYISLYTDESSLKMNSVDHIPQTLASHSRPSVEEQSQEHSHFSSQHGADMLKPDPRDTFYSTPMIQASRLENVLPACLYSPTYVVKDFPIARYQGLQFVYLSFIYPNDFTRLTHMERENKCFYRESPIYLEKPTLGEREGEEENSIVVRREKKQFLKSDGQPDREWDKDGPRRRGEQTSRRGLLERPEAESEELHPQSDNAVHGRSLSWIRTGPSELGPGGPGRKGGGGGGAGEETPPKLSKSSLLFPQKTSLSALASRAKQILSNSAPGNNAANVRLHDNAARNHGNDKNAAAAGNNNNREKKDENKIYITSINWQRTFSVNPMDFELLRSDWNDLRCNVSGNLQLAESEVVDVLAQYMEKLNERNGGIYTLLRIINVEKRRDSARGNRYLVELELMERGRNVVRLSEYIYLLLHRGRTPAPPTSTHPPAQPGPVMLQWRKDVMVHFVVPVKNQARWVQQFITDMEELHRQTKDDNFSIIIVDFESTDMDVEQALRESTVPRYEYLRREGNFERSAGLQIGVDTIEDNHSIAFLCDLHIHFPHNILESIRKHCVEGRLAFAPIVMRLGCGSSPLEPDGYWEVNGFGLFGIYKSDFDKIGGMNTEEFKDRWGGEDWELLDRVLQNGLEVERLRLRNFFHYYHSKRGMWNAQNKKNPKGGG